jgi:hypothetical protein
MQFALVPLNIFFFLGGWGGWAFLITASFSLRFLDAFPQHRTVRCSLGYLSLGACFCLSNARVYLTTDTDREALRKKGSIRPFLL